MVRVENEIKIFVKKLDLVSFMAQKRAPRYIQKPFRDNKHKARFSVSVRGPNTNRREVFL